MKTTEDTHVPLTGFPHYPEAEMQARARAFHDSMATRRSVRASAAVAASARRGTPAARAALHVSRADVLRSRLAPTATNQHTRKHGSRS